MDLQASAEGPALTGPGADESTQDPEPGPPTVPSPTAGRPSGVALDIQGTLLDGGGRPLPGSVETLAELRSAGTAFVLASNQTSMAAHRLAEQLRLQGFAVEDEDVLTTASLTATLLRDRYRGAAIAFYGDRLPFDADGLELVEDRPDVVVLAGAGEWISHGTLSSILRQVRAGADLVAMHRGLYWETEGGLALDVGALLPGLEQATGTRAHVVGKPSPAFFERALASKGIGATGALMVGDDIQNDVLAAQRLGMTGVLVRTGKYSGDRVEGVAEYPCHVIDSIADLPNLLKGDEAR